MSKPFRMLFAVLASCLILFSCIKKTNAKETAENLKTAMGLYLNHQPMIDTSRVKFKVLDVSFFEDNTKYICEFKVNMQEKQAGQLKDTTGVMSANISKDFKDVTRRN